MSRSARHTCRRVGRARAPRESVSEAVKPRAACYTFPELASRAQDDGFHEIQLSGKQLVFLFMAATVVSVVIFLCGVLVGRGVRAERATLVAEAAAPTEPPLPPPQPAPAAQPGNDPTETAPPPTAGELTYPRALARPGSVKDDLKPAKPAQPAKPVAKDTPPAATKGTTAKAEPALKAEAKPETPKAAPEAKPAPATSTAPAAGDGEFTVQVAAVNARSEADSIARRLSSKGYAAYVVRPGNGAAMYRVRVGRFKTRHDAEPVAARLKREEQYTPWITR
jgi:cell division septation protein DedD